MKKEIILFNILLMIPTANGQLSKIGFSIDFLLFLVLVSMNLRQEKHHQSRITNGLKKILSPSK